MTKSTSVFFHFAFHPGRGDQVSARRIWKYANEHSREAKFSHELPCLYTMDSSAVSPNVADLEASFRTDHPLAMCIGSAWQPQTTSLLSSEHRAQWAMSVAQQEGMPATREPGVPCHRRAHLYLVPRGSPNPPSGARCYK